MLITQEKTNIKYLLIVVILAVFAGGTIIGTSKMMDQYYQQPSSQQIQSVKDETADWKTYTNEIYDYSFKYPPEAIISEVSLGDFVMDYRENYEKYTGKICITVRYKQAQLYISAPENKDNRYAYCPFPGLGIGEQFSSKSISESISIAGKIYTAKGSEIIFKKNGLHDEFLYLRVENETNFFYSVIGAKSETEILNQKAIINQMLSTFNFLDQNFSGTIEGSLGYPSEGIPADMKVCAENIKTKEQYCTSTHIENSKYKYGKGYKINLPPGDYYVFATLLSLGDYKAYYSEFVTCGIKVGCSSHDPIKVTVADGEIIENIDPQDWYKTNP
jgi:hypothetical protein